MRLNVPLGLFHWKYIYKQINIIPISARHSLRGRENEFETKTIIISTCEYTRNEQDTLDRYEILPKNNIKQTLATRVYELWIGSSAILKHVNGRLLIACTIVLWQKYKCLFYDVDATFRMSNTRRKILSCENQSNIRIFKWQTKLWDPIRSAYQDSSVETSEWWSWSNIQLETGNYGIYQLLKLYRVEKLFETLYSDDCQSLYTNPSFLTKYSREEFLSNTQILFQTNSISYDTLSSRQTSFPRWSQS